jgi:hypothetical protein
MPGAVPAFREGPVTFVTNANATIVGGMLVESDGGTPALIRPAGAGSAVVIGVATNDSVGTAVSQVPTVPGADSPVVNVSIIDQYNAVATKGVWRLTYAAAATFGARLKAAANGQVTPWVSGTDNPELIVGVCYESAGVSGAGVVGLTRLAGLGA